MQKSPFSLAGTVALVTGGAKGVGAGIASAMAEAGALVVVADINADGARAKADDLAAQGLASDWLKMDVSHEQSVIDASAELVRRHGAPWAVVNNAGIQNRQYISDESAEAWDRMQAVNARGPFLLTRELGKAMVAGGQGGRIINIASGVLAGMLVKGAAAYVASKGALAGFTSVAALEFAQHGITVNAILPGAIPTPGTLGAKGPPTEGPGMRPAVFGFSAPEDIGLAAVYLASPAARMTTNQMLSVDGGFSLS